MKSRPHLRGVAIMPSVILALLAASSGAIAQPAARPAISIPPDNPAASASPTSTPGATAETAAARRKRALTGVVMVRRGKTTVALGSVLAGDGRILTALSALGDGNDLDAYFADGSHVRVKVGHHDRVWDLALLVPQSGRWSRGLQAATAAPLPDAEAYAFAAVAGKPALTRVKVRGARTLVGGDAQPLTSAIELGAPIAAADLGGPILDGEGRVIAVAARACSPNQGKPCTPVSFGAPMSAVRAFLRSVPASAAALTPWIGIQGASDSAEVARGVRIVSIHRGSPAEEAKLQSAADGTPDLILAVDGTPVTSPDGLAESLRSFGVGDVVPLIVLRKGRYLTVPVTLRAPLAPSSSSSAPRQPVSMPALQID